MFVRGYFEHEKGITMERLLSVIIPAFNEGENIERTASVISEILEGAGIFYEIIFVDDGSKDNTWALICRENRRNNRVKGLSFSRNFGKDAACFAGLSYAGGDASVVIDCDLQHPPEKIVDMYRMWEDGYQVVEGIKLSRGKESFLHTLSTKLFYVLISKATGLDMKSASDFKLLDKRAADALLTMSEREPFFRALSSWIGFKKGQVEFEVRERSAGESNWSVKSLISYAIANITGFSTAPMQFATVCGIISFAVAVVLIITGLVGNSDFLSRLPFFTVSMFVLSGCILSSLGIIGYYVGKIYRQVLARPRYIVNEIVGDIKK